MLHALRLLLPALVPSWRFFDTIAASPRIEHALLKSAQDSPGHWQEFRPRPEALSISRVLGRLVWNPRWNESLFLVSCAERLMDVPTEHSAREIRMRIHADLKRQMTGDGFFQFRLVFVHRDGQELQRNVTFISPVYSLDEKVAA